jgi:hypothetical protein
MVSRDRMVKTYFLGDVRDESFIVRDDNHSAVPFFQGEHESVQTL